VAYMLPDRCLSGSDNGQQLQTLGFCVIPNLVPVAKLATIAAAYDRAFALATSPDLRTSSSGGSTRLVDFVTRGVEFDALYVLEPVLSACAATIGSEFKLSSFGGRTVQPGAAAQGLHVDVRPDEDAWPLLGFIVMVDEFREGNGATRFVPGSHHAEPTNVREGNQRPGDDAQVLACGPAGSVIVYFGSTWHGYSANRSTSPRRSIQGAYIPRSGTAAVQWRSRLSLETLGRLSHSARRVLAID
jgi:ectoine hydroxylase-related dioxygenase (phytanoyl-CoA dioxygenase family)